MHPTPASPSANHPFPRPRSPASLNCGSVTRWCAIGKGGPGSGRGTTMWMDGPPSRRGVRRTEGAASLESVETQDIIFVISEVIDFAGVVIIALGALLGVILCAQDLLHKERAVDAYSRLRTFLGRSLLLGLEFLVAGDIIKTVAIEPTFDSVIVLAIIVLVRTVLSLSIDVEIDGRWPWQAAQQARLVETAPTGTPEVPRHPEGPQ